MAKLNVAGRSASSELVGLLELPEIGRPIADLEATRWTGRPGYPIRAMVGLALAKSLYAVPTWTNLSLGRWGRRRPTNRGSPLR